MSYIGYFKSLHNDYLYSVTIKKKGDTTTPKEIILSGEEPFRVSYGETTTIFEPIRTSVATIKVISEEYMEDILPSKAQETEIILKNDTKGIVEWVGYLTPKIYSQGYENEFEEIELEAADVLSSTQYMDYIYENTRGMVTFKEFIIGAFKDTLIEGFYWPSTKFLNDNIITPEILKISERNFYTSDTDEPWSYQEVLEEMCKYLGITCIQWQNKIYFMDYTAIGGNTEKFQFKYFPKAAEWMESSSINSGEKRTIKETDIYGNGETISFEPIYNKIVVKDNFYTCDELFKNLFDDDALTNRGEDFFSSFQLVAPPIDPKTGKPLPNRPSYPWGGNLFGQQKYVNDEDDTKYYYWHRLYDHEDFESVYRDDSLVEITPSNLNGIDTTKLYIGGTIVDLGRVEKDYVSDAFQYIILNKINWERYLLISQRAQGWTNTLPNEKMVVFRTKPGMKGQVLMDSTNSYLIIYYQVLFEKYEYRNYINPDWSTNALKKGKWESGGLGQHSSELAFKLGFGGKYWDGEKWTTDSKSVFTISHTREGEKESAVYNEAREVLNNVRWDLNIEQEGYKIPLEGIDTSGEIVFEIFLPKTQTNANMDGIKPPSKYNQYCWIKDFKISTANVGQDMEVEESDVVYENVIDEGVTYELGDIELKFTTSTQNTKPSYSNVAFWDGSKNVLLSTINENILPDKGLKPEENIIQRYYQQYSTPTKKLSYSLGIDYTPFDKYYNVDIENPSIGFVQNGVEIDYARDTQIMTLIQKK